VKQFGGLEGMAAPLAADVAGSDAAQFLIDERGDGVQGVPVAALPALEQSGNR